MELSPLHGSDRQVAWANDIRDEVLAELAELDLAPGVHDATVELLASVADATWWIDRRNTRVPDLPDMLGVGRPALDRRPSYEQDDSPGFHETLDMAREVRAKLQEAGIARTECFLAVEALGILEPWPSFAYERPGYTHLRRQFEQRVTSALEDSPWELRLGAIIAREPMA